MTLFNQTQDNIDKSSIMSILYAETFSMRAVTILDPRVQTLWYIRYNVNERL